MGTADSPVPDLPEPTQEQLEILEAIRKNPYISEADLAQRFSMSTDSIGRRLKDLRDKDWLDVRYIPNLSAMGYSLRYRLDVKINPGVLVKELEKLKGSKVLGSDNPQKILAAYIKNTLETRFLNRVIVDDILIILGDPADLCVTVRVHDHVDVFDWVTAGLRAIPGIENTSTCLEAWSILEGTVSEKRKKRFRGSRG
jgi:DNA-binding Lrp family transcriptional regulator